MPILEINILGSNIEISYQEGEKEKLLYLVKQFKLRLSKFENLKVRFADFKIILLAASIFMSYSPIILNVLILFFRFLLMHFLNKQPI